MPSDDSKFPPLLTIVHMPDNASAEDIEAIRLHVKDAYEHGNPLIVGPNVRFEIYQLIQGEWKTVGSGVPF